MRRNTAATYCARRGLGSNEAIRHAIVGGLGLSVLSLHTLTLEGPDGPVALLDVEGFPIMSQWYLVYPKGKELSPVARAFLDFALEIEPKMREQMQEVWPNLAANFKAAKTKKKSGARKKA